MKRKTMSREKARAVKSFLNEAVISIFANAVVVEKQNIRHLNKK